VAVPLAVLVGLTLPQAPVPVAPQVTVQVTPEFDESFVTVAVTVNVPLVVTMVALAATETEITAGGVVVVVEVLPPPQATSAAIMTKLATSKNDWRSLIGFLILFGRGDPSFGRQLYPQCCGHLGGCRAGTAHS
jgi:hypothetical protein